MDQKYTKLFEPGFIGKLRLKNRLIFPPMAFSFDNVGGDTTDRKMEFYAQLARGGCAMVIPVTMFADPFEVDPDWHRALPYAVAKTDSVRQGARMFWAPLHWSEERNPRLYDLTELVHVSGGLIAAALGSGIFGWSQAYTKKHPEAKTKGWAMFDALTTGEVEALIEEFANVASWMRASDFDAIEMNMTGFPDYFESMAFNHRTDRFGGSEEACIQYAKELVQATRKAVGPDFPLIYMFDPDFFTKGLRTLDQALVFADKLKAWGVDAVRLRGGGWAKVEYEIPNMYIPEGVGVFQAEAFRKRAGIPVVTGGKLGNPALAEKVLAEGKADFIALGRSLIADHDWPKKVMAGEADRVRRCISCNIGCLGRVTQVPRKPSRCTVNPLFGNAEKFRHLGPALIKKKVAVVGGGPAGMAAALSAAQRGHEVTLYEKTSKLGGGGQFWLATLPPFKEDLAFIPAYYEREFKGLKSVTIKLGAAATAAMVMDGKPDAVVIATGAEAARAGIPGAEAPSVLTYAEVLSGTKQVGSSAVIIGGGNVGCETAIFLVKKGIKVTIIEMLNRLADNEELSNRNTIMRELGGKATILLGTRVSAIEGGTVRYAKGQEPGSVAAETVILALGAKPVNGLYDELRGKVTDLWVVGDAKQPRQIMHAVSEGFYAGFFLGK